MSVAADEARKMATIHVVYSHYSDGSGEPLFLGADIRKGEAERLKALIEKPGCCQQVKVAAVDIPADQVASFKCRAYPPSIGPHTPQECNWPVCGCDPYADKVIAALQEHGLLKDQP